MKYVLVDSQATVHFRYLVAVEDHEDLDDALEIVDNKEVDDLVQCWDDEEITHIEYAQDDDILNACKGSYMESWGIRQIKEVFCISSKQDDTSEK